MANDVRVRASVIDNVSGPLGKIRDQFKLLGDKQTRTVALGTMAGNALSNAFGSAASAIGAFVGDSVKAASDLNESLSKSQVVFGSSAKAAEAFASTAAESFGMSKQAALEAQATFGNFFTGIGQSQNSAEQMSEQLVRLAGDLASFNNLDPSDVLLKLRSGLTGEAEPLRSVGVFLTEAKMKAKAMEMGLADAHGELSEGAKVLARYQIILDETKTAQGDFARTADGLANSQRKANAELADAQASFGQNLLPAQLAVTKSASDLLEKVNLTAKAFDYLTGKTNLSAQEQRDLARSLTQGLGPLSDWFHAALDAADAEEKAKNEAMWASMAFKDQSYQAVEDARAIRGLAGDTEDLAGSEVDAKKRTDELAAAFKRAEERTRDMRSEMDKLAGSLYEDKILAGDLAQAQQDLTDLMDEEPINKNSQAHAIWAGKVAEVKARIFDLGYQIAAMSGSKALYDWLETQKRQLGKTDKATRDLIEDLEQLARLTSYKETGKAPIEYVDDYIDPLNGSLYGGPRAAGGPVDPSHVYRVGERGPEWFVPKVPGTIVPNGGPSGGSGGGSYAINVTVSGGALTPGAARELGTSLGPSIATWLQRQGLIARSGSPIVG